MCTIGGLISRDTTLLLKNFDYPPSPTGWAYFSTFDGGIPHFALVDHGQQGVNSGLNRDGLGLLISRSKATDPASPEALELRTVLNAEVLSRCSTVGQAIEQMEQYARQHPEMYGGNVILGDGHEISVSEYSAGRAMSQTVSDGYLARANHSEFGLLDNATEGSQMRRAKMLEFLRTLHPRIDGLQTDEILDACKPLLRSWPICHEATRSSFVILVQERRVEYMVGDGPWHTFAFEKV